MNVERFKKNVIHATDNTMNQLLRNAVVGLFTLGCDLMLLYLLVDFLNIQKVVASVLASIFGGIVNFTVSSKWVFNERRFSNITLEFLLFSIIGVIGLGLNALIFWVMTHFVGCYYLLSKIIACFLVFLTTFFLRKYLIFFKKSGPTPQKAEEVTLPLNTPES